MNRSSWHVAVLIPARNEEELLPRCLNSVLAACSLLPPSFTSDIVVACDSSTDLTLEIAERILPGHGTVITTQAGVVGHVRGIATRVALKRYSGPLQRCWLANTDADCCVPKKWLVDQLALAQRGVDTLAGIIDVDSFEEHDPGVETRFRDSYLIHDDGSHPHVHGANFGIRADAYLRCGGWRELATGEDHDLWNRLRSVCSRRCSTARIKVLTSGRRIGRAPAGFADALSAHDEAVAC